MTSGGLSESPVKRHVAKEEGRPKFITIKLTGYSMTRRNTKCYGLTVSKYLNVVFSNTFCNSTLCACISQKPDQQLKCSKVRCKKEEEHIQIIYKLKIEICPQVLPFCKYCYIYTATLISEWLNKPLRLYK